MGAYTPVAMERVRKGLKTQKIERRRCKKECARISKERRYTKTRWQVGRFERWNVEEKEVNSSLLEVEWVGTETDEWGCRREWAGWWLTIKEYVTT